MPSVHSAKASPHGLFLRTAIDHPQLLFIFATTVIFLFAWIVWLPSKKPRLLPNTPFAGLAGGSRSLTEARNQFRTHAAEMLIEGYKRASGQTDGGFYYVPGPDHDRLMIPTKYLNELKNAPDDKADFLGSFSEMFEGEYTTIGKRWNLHPRVVKQQLNPSLPVVLPPVEEEIEIAAARVFPPCDDWTPVPVVSTVTQIIAQASGRMIGGVRLSRNLEWLETSLSFTHDAWLAAQRLKQYPFWARPVVQWVIPEMKALRHRIAIAQKFIKPILTEREQLSDTKEKPVDLIQMLYDGARGADRDNNFLAYTALVVSFAAIHTSASVPAHLIFDLCARPEYIQPLRKELEEELATDGHFTKASFAKLVKMDSFMKESQRFNPLVFMTFGRVICDNHALHDGVVIPAGTIIGVPSHAIANDPKFCKDPEKFDGFRWIPPDEKDADAQAPPSFVTTNPHNLAWGYGKHACSGRFFASFEIKMVMAYILLNYDFKFEEGRKERPANVAFELQNAPDPSVHVLFKRRSV
ncbi:putative cytochrome P450 [Lentithecium fluviatile CBS 122367]|uniref:Putative cytochrome P450 n=1 Tax=Lentithecium fluviatile CBS 122367 TaxID=1168545 RepID=A0A6G1IGT0_9PLEO|nr:putative cytochrome P450 [Lentithecium fluviatile CBS 122367]